MNRFDLTSGKPGPMGPPALARYGSAPGSLLASIADSVINSQPRSRDDFSVFRSEPVMSRFYPGESSGLTSSDSSCRTGAGSSPDPRAGSYAFIGGVIHAPMPDLSGSHNPASAPASAGPPAPPTLVRHSSSPAGLLSHVLVDPQGLSGTKGMGSYSHAGTETVDLLTNSRLRPQWSFSRQDSLSQISDINLPDMGDGVTASWAEAGTIFSNHISKRGREDSDDFITTLGNMDEMSNIEYMQMHQDVATCKLRAKRGCATHPRSIAERERRTRISKRLRKLQELMPNMDKQASTSDMLDLAVQYIKDLQGQVQVRFYSTQTLSMSFLLKLQIKEI
ncbi:basic helix-loop-helix (bHLH) DNA-binding superfamily protein [Rhynchospora pubera]|uniref:Basic helix-loop-helix (BHLH) DNA-binding superfamily protein n=1 Tax=Rhynchospora pubera TaxID=906938 RepID=A0AAV8E1M7_9POAL|nr:basic helix-loop-helix (bHLH) DNA-binding superfamily protein [Rhynchospora pubera]